tara:strand:- start:236 stop:379 length:144 start_codon:yes stop_codon:yes gene_type:complete
MELYAILGLIAALGMGLFTTGSSNNQNGGSKKTRGRNKKRVRKSKNN